MRNRLYILVMMLCVSMSSAFAQVIITGNVADAIEPLMMVNVVEVDEAGRRSNRAHCRITLEADDYHIRGVKQQLQNIRCHKR